MGRPLIALVLIAVAVVAVVFAASRACGDDDDSDSDPAASDTGIAWARTTFDALAPHMAERAYTNYLPADDHDRVRQAFSVNYQRLVELKRRYDPDNLFHLNQNIDPARSN